MLLRGGTVPLQDVSNHQGPAGNQKDLSIDQLAALAEAIMLSQANFHNLMAEVDADYHNADVFTDRQLSSASPTPSKEKKKNAVR